jgi:uncharacterized membrane protein
MASPSIARTTGRRTDAVRFGILKAVLLAVALLPIVIGVAIWDLRGKPEWS